MIRESAVRTASTSRLLQCVETCFQSEPPLRRVDRGRGTLLALPLPAPLSLVPLDLGATEHAASHSLSLSSGDRYDESQTGPSHLPAEYQSSTMVCDVVWGERGLLRAVRKVRGWLTDRAGKASRKVSRHTSTGSADGLSAGSALSGLLGRVCVRGFVGLLTGLVLLEEGRVGDEEDEAEAVE